MIVSVERSRAGNEIDGLQLYVVINSVPAQIIGSFVRLSDGRIAAKAEELESLGLRAGSRPPDDIVPLDDVPTLKYQYEERTQKIRITVDDVGRKPKDFDLRDNSAGRLQRGQAGLGAVLNYDLLSSTQNFWTLRSISYANTSATLNARVFWPYGTAEQSAIVLTGPKQTTELIRLNSSYRYSDQERLVSYVAGDTINGGLAWSRPIRIGGLQAQSNFSLRPDLITAPLARLGGSAAVPSTVDVYVNNIKTFSQDVGTGPFSVNNVPLISGAGTTQLVIRDSSGNETKTVVPFYASASLLAPGLTSWSLEGGMPRLSYGATNDLYAGSPVGSATLRGGIFDWLTAEAHAEHGAGITNVGAGAVVRTGTIGVGNLAISGSNAGWGKGLQIYASYETQLFGLNISASSQHTFGAYEDLASATARLQNIVATGPNTLNGLFTYVPITALPVSSAFAYVTGVYNNAHAPVALDRLTISAPMPLDPKASLSASLVHLVDASSNISNIATVSYTRSMPYNASLFATVFRDFGHNRNTGLFAGVSVPLGDSTSVSTGVSKGNSGTTGTFDATRSPGLEPGSYGWRVQDAEGAMPYRAASASYRSTYGTIQAGGGQLGSSTTGSLELRGSIVTMGGGVFLSNWMDDGFAVIKTGTPGVEVMNENRSMGVTDSKGMLLVPTLRSYQKNKITIDPTNLPVDIDVASTHEIVAPADHAGVLVSFDVRRDTTSALVTFVGPGGGKVPVGASGRIADGPEFVVGYDGQAFIKNLSSINEVDIEFVDGRCHASFPFAPQPGEQVQIPHVECK